jgi:CRP/FNR family transcriptional regulator, cyclic AMP receptor protein
MSWLASLKPELAEEIRNTALVRSYTPGETIFGPIREPENVWLVEHGLVRIHRLAPDGRQMTIALVRPGQIFGEVPVLSDSPRISFAEAMRRSTCWRIPREGFLRVVRSDPEAGFHISKEVAGRMAHIENRLEELAFRNVDSRLARTLLRLAEDFGRAAGEWVELEVSLTQAELATLVGTTRQSISESLRGLVEGGCVARDRGRLAVRLDALAKAGDSPLG